MSESIDQAVRKFRKDNAATVARTRAGIESVRRTAIANYSLNLARRKALYERVAKNLERNVEEIQWKHRQIREKLGEEAVRREVHMRVTRSLEALDTFVRVQKTSVTGDVMITAIRDPAISGSAADRQRRGSVVELMQSVQKQLVQQTEFINIAAHELRTPIMPILLNAEMLEDGLGKDSEEIQSIKRNALRLQRLAENILNVARIDTNSLVLRKEPLDLNALLTQIVTEKRWTSGPVRIRPQLSPRNPIVEADGSRVEQVLSNLLDNALKFTDEGMIEVSSEVRGTLAFVTVKDEGTGIEPDILPLLFTKFSAKSEGGTGLGLFICKGIIEALGGTITGANNPDGRGATFEFTLPLAVQNGKEA